MSTPDDDGFFAVIGASYKIGRMGGSALEIFEARYCRKKRLMVMASAHHHRIEVGGFVAFE